MKSPIRRGARPNAPARSSQSLRPKQSLGQNFLRDENISRKIVASLNARRDDVVLEIGPGEAALTKYLAPQLNKLIVVDVDERVIGKMRKLFADGAVEVLHQDFLETDFSNILQQRNAPKLRIIGNISYGLFIWHLVYLYLLFPEIDNKLVGAGPEIVKSVKPVAAWFMPLVLAPAQLVMAMASFVLVEKPLMMFGRR